MCNTHTHTHNVGDTNEIPVSEKSTYKFASWSPRHHSQAASEPVSPPSMASVPTNVIIYSVPDKLLPSLAYTCWTRVVMKGKILYLAIVTVTGFLHSPGTNWYFRVPKLAICYCYKGSNTIYCCQ